MFVTTECGVTVPSRRLSVNNVVCAQRCLLVVEGGVTLNCHWKTQMFVLLQFHSNNLRLIKLIDFDGSVSSRELRLLGGCSPPAAAAVTRRDVTCWEKIMDLIDSYVKGETECGQNQRTVGFQLLSLAEANT